MIIEYTYLDKNNKKGSGMSTVNIIDSYLDFHPGWLFIRDSLPEKFQDSYMNQSNSLYKIHSFNEKPAVIIKNNKNEIKIIEYFKEGFNHRDNGPSIQIKTKKYNKIMFHLNGNSYLPYKFAEETNHLICKSCRTFCKQCCF